MQLCGSLSILWHCLSLGLEWKLTFSVLWPLLSFPNLLAYWVQHFHSIIFQGFEIAQLEFHPLPLFVVMLSKAHLTSHSRMSGSRWVIIPSWLSFLLYSSSVYSCHLFLISSASFRSIPFLSFIEAIFACNAPLVSLIFLKSYVQISKNFIVDEARPENTGWSWRRNSHEKEERNCHQVLGKVLETGLAVS